MSEMYKCPRCVGTGQLESSDSTDDSWWDCPTCEGTGKLADRRRTQAVGERDALRDELLSQALSENERLRAALEKLADPKADCWDRYSVPHRHTQKFAREALHHAGARR